jgi:hypothetical protein
MKKPDHQELAAPLQTKFTGESLHAAPGVTTPA